MSSYTPIAALEIIPGQPVKPSLFQRLDANDQAVPSPEVYLTGAVNTWTAPESKYYKFTCTGKGGKGGDASVNYRAGGGGGAGATGIIRLYVEKNTLWTAVFSGASGGTNTFSDGVTTLEFKNGSNGKSNDRHLDNSGGAGGGAGTGFDIEFLGASGSNTRDFLYEGAATPGTFGLLPRGGDGANSIYGGGGKGRHHDSGNGGAASTYGAGGGGAVRILDSGTGGAGGAALIIIEG
jgi:hypothetical protein